MLAAIPVSAGDAGATGLLQRRCLCLLASGSGVAARQHVG
jgi:hypothetical protein